jgi:hypothetical protein
MGVESVEKTGGVNRSGICFELSGKGITAVGSHVNQSEA